MTEENINEAFSENDERFDNESLNDQEEAIVEDEMDEIADYAIETIQDITAHFNLGEITIDEYEGEEGELILDIGGEDMSVLIGRHGATLDALQVMVSSIVRTKIKCKIPIIIDIEGYKSRQKEKLEALAYSTADRVISNKRRIKMRPMKPYERRIIHMALRDDSRVETISEGEGRNRHVIVYPLDSE